MTQSPGGGWYEVDAPRTDFDLVLEQLLMGTLADEDKYALEFECTRCGHQGTVRSSHPVRVEWDRDFDDQCIGDAIGVTTEVIAEFWITVDREFVDAWQGGSEPPVSYYGISLGCVHECSRGRESNDRAALSPNPPPRSSSIERAVDE